MSKNIQNQNLSSSPIIDGNITPDVDATYDIGTATNRFRNEYLSGTVNAANSNFTNTSNQTVFASASSGPITLNVSPSSNLGGFVATIPDCEQNSNFMMTASLVQQTVTTPTTFNNLKIGTGDGIQMGTGSSTTTLFATTPAASRAYTLPDSGGNSNVMLSDGNQTFTGTITFQAAPIANSLSANALVATNSSKALTNSTSSISPTFNTAKFTNASQTSSTNGFVIQTNTTTPWDALYIEENTNGTSKRAGIKFGSNWEMLQDSANSGSKNWALVNENTGNHSVDIDPSTDDITCAGEVIANGGFSSTTNQTDWAVFIPATSLNFSGGTWTLTRSGSGLYFMQKTAAADTSYVICSIPLALRTSSNKGYELTSFTVAYNVQTAALTSATPNVYTTGMSDNQAIFNTTTMSLTRTLTTATNSNLYYKTISVSSPVFASSNADTYIEIAFVAQSTTQLIVYGIQLNFTVNYT